MKKLIKIFSIAILLSIFCTKPEDFYGTIEVRSEPEGAEVYLDGEDTGKKTNCTINVAPGNHTIKLKKEGYFDYEKEITVESGKQVEISISLPIPIQWVHVPAGWFTMGSDDSDSDADGDEKPQHQVYLDGYYISKYEVTNAQYCKFLNEHGNDYNGYECIDLDVYSEIYYSNGSYYVKSGYENYPVRYVTWYGAKAFCEYYGWRLPTEAEWEKAARGTDKRKYPWGNHDPYYNGKYYANYDPGDDDADGYEYTAPVGSYPQGVSPYGCYDMAGNVWEWCNDWYDYDYYSNSPDHNPQGPSSGYYRVCRGGGWFNCNARYIRCASRDYDTPSGRFQSVGFRPVKDE